MTYLRIYLMKFWWSFWWSKSNSQLNSPSNSYFPKTNIIVWNVVIILYDFSFERNCNSADSPVDTETQSSNKLPVLQTATALATAFAICKIASYLTKLGLKGGILPAVTAIVVVLATIFPAQFGYLAPTGEAIALILMQVYPVQCYFLCKTHVGWMLTISYEQLWILLHRPLQSSM